MTDLSRKLEIEPMAEPEWRRIERALFAKLDQEPLVATPPALVDVRRRPPWRAALALAATGVCAGVLAFALLRSDSPDRPSLHTSRVVTNDSTSHLDFGGVALDVAPNSALVVSGTDESGVLIVLESGAVTCAVEPRGDRPPVTVQAGDVRVEVVGTVFTVVRDGASAKVAVSKGTVRVVKAGSTSLVRQGERWPPRATPGTDQGGSSDDPVVFTIDEADEITRRGRRHRPPEREAAPVAPPASVAAEQAASGKQLYKEAERLEASDPGAAIAVYAEVADTGGPWAANALFAQGRLELERGNDEVAARLLRRYLHRYPNGANKKDATDLLEALQRP